MENNKEKKDQKVDDLDKEKVEEKALRKILIETDGNMAKISLAEVAGNLELKAILIGLANNIK